MKNKKEVKNRIGRKRFLKDLKRRKRKSYWNKSQEKTKDNYRNVIEIKDSFLSETLNFIKDNYKTKLLCPAFLNTDKQQRTKVIKVPKLFSLIENANETYGFIQNVINAVYHDKGARIKLDYSNCREVHIGAQLFLDILLKEIFKYAKELASKHNHLSGLLSVEPINLNDINVEKLLSSVGSFAIHRNENNDFPDIIPYRLCEFKNRASSSILFNIEKKEQDVTAMVDYVVDSLGRMNKILTSDSLEDLSIIIGEILINAEEHSTFNHRYSIGYFQEFNNKGDSFGIFNLAILNFGDTIYDKFKSPNCPRQDIVQQMTELSNQYTSKNLFGDSIKEETLWTLYALQEEITSVSKIKNEKRGNGSIKFIESFFNLKGNVKTDRKSKLAILSGNTSIIFDGSHGIMKKNKGKDEFRVMTFNDKGDIADRPDSKFVKFVPNHFPGTIITAQILISKDDIL